MLRTLLAPILLCLAAQAAGCAGEEDEGVQAPIASSAEDIRGGTVTAPGELEAVGIVHGYCTGTLISNDAVLSAARCVCDLNSTQRRCETRVTFTFKNVLPVGSTTRTDVTVNADVHPYDHFENQHPEINDFVVLRLDTPANQLVQVTPMQVAKAMPQTGEIHTLVGFGMTSSASGPSTTCDTLPDGQRRKVATMLDAIFPLGQSDGVTGWSLLYADAGKGACPVDFGGPAINAAGRIVGVSASADPSNSSNYNPISKAYDWLQDHACPLFSAAAPDAAFCSELCPCASAQSDCDLDSDCRPGASCVSDVGAGIGYPGEYDVCWGNEQLVTLWRDPGFTGPSRRLPLGQWDVADLGGVGNDGLSSLKIPAGLTVRGFSEGACWGNQQAFSGDVSDIVGSTHDSVSCVRVLPGVTVYDGQSFTGTRQTFEIGRYNAAALTTILNDHVSSLIATPGISVRLCPESGPPGGVGWGTCTDLGGRVATLGAIDNNTSHIEVRAGATLYAGANFAGAQQSLPAGQFGPLALGGVGDRVLSIVVAPGMQARVCAELGLSNHCETFTGWVAYLGGKLTGEIKSVVVSPLE